MGQEIERKFRVNGEEWRAHADGGVRLEQFYLFVGSDKSCRVRIRDGREARLTIKTGSGIARGEFEYEIPIEDAEALRTTRDGAVIEKVRYRVPHGDLVAEIDVFEGALSGLVLGEIELPAADHAFELPSFFGPELTGDPAFTNASMALRGSPDHEDRS
ncbi:CYTH domain-containing protein [Fulvimarina endophytica]|uniref:CYTH domain-containing protein n=1 Tax=Fulvimarina endophytica TaxID=2293836 RepID=A0A371X7V9_9HYPH|nr:CYTH domain-containing protein [Fulvimarina endophytica]RFC65339.1 CYTH domain-containing protein [Fulvimarina endophytica]